MSRSWIVGILSIAMFFIGYCIFPWNWSTPVSLNVRYEAGEAVKEGELARVRVVLTNRSASPFHVESVTTSCGCMQPKTAGVPFEKGLVLREKSDTPIDVEIGTTGKPGNVEHALRIVGFCGDRAKPFAVEAKIRIMIIGGVKIVPSEVVLVDGEPGKPIESDVLILDGGSGDSEKVDLDRLSSQAAITGEFENIDPSEMTGTPVEGYVPKRRYHFTFIPRDSVDPEQEFIDFKVPEAGQETLFRVKVLCRKKAPELVLSPPALTIAANGADGELTREILCVSNGKAGSEVAVVSKPDDVRADVKKLRQGRHVIAVTIPSKRLADHGDFEMRIEAPAQPLHSVTYHVRFVTRE